MSAEIISFNHRPKPEPKKHAPGSCRFWHQWSKWVVVRQGPLVSPGHTHPHGNYIEQQRHCVRCDAIQLRNVRT